jgi:hypothetical protein
VTKTITYDYEGIGIPDIQTPTMNQLEIQFRSVCSGTSQCAVILHELREKTGQWVAMPNLVRSSGSFNVHSRISDLRKHGHRIEVRIDRGADGKNHSYYRLVA